MRHAHTSRHPASRQRGLTLVEAIVVITLVGVVGTLVSGLLRYPINAYVDLTRRTEITDAADTALRRMARELQSALPNSVRVSGNYIEFLPVVAAGRYRAARSSIDNSGDVLDFSSTSDSSFDVLGPSVSVAAGDQLVIHNLGLPGADAYEGSSRRTIPAAATGVNTLVYDTGGTQFPFGSPGNRFFVVNRPVTFACMPGLNGTGTLRRVSGYAIQPAQPVNIAGAPLNGQTGANNALLASMVTTCSFSYSNSASSRNGIVTIQLTLSGGGESVTLLQQLHVGNSP